MTKRFETKRFRFLILAITSVLLASATGEVYAQSDARQQQSLYTRNQLNQVTARSTVSRYGANQLRNQVTNRTIPQYAYSNASRNLNRNLRRATPSARPTKPFSGIVRSPSTTPYLGLSRPFGGVSDIYDVRRQASQQRLFQQQQRANERQQRQNVALQNQLNQLAAEGPYNVQGSETLTPTGHSAVFMNDGGYRMNYGGFFPQR